MVNRSSLPSANDKKKQERGECSTRARNTDRGVATTVTVETVPPVTFDTEASPAFITAGNAVNIQQGRSKSGRAWKAPKKHRHSSILKVGGKAALRISWSEKVAEKERKAAIKTKEKELLAAKKDRYAEKRRKQQDNAKRREENEKRAQVVQAISSQKVKKLSKKQLKYVRKA